jgi:alpha-galactosidase
MTLKKATLAYRVFDKTFSEDMMERQQKGTFFSLLQGFSFVSSSTKTKDINKLSSYLSWNRPEERPSVGLRLFTLTLSLDTDFLETEGLKIFQHGYQSWSLSGSYSPEERDESPSIDMFKYSEENHYTKHSGKKGSFISEGFLVAYSAKTHKGFLIGTMGGDFHTKCDILVDEDGKLQSLSIIYELYCAPEFRYEQKHELNQIVLETFESEYPEAIFEKYFQSLAKANKLKPAKEIPTGWCSWYYYYTNISEEILLTNLQEIKNKNLPISFFQIDDGYQKEIGDWLTFNERFPNGLKPIVEQIRENGLKPGLWLAPFLVRKNSDFFQLYPEAVLKDDKGQPVPALWNPLWGLDYTYTIDVTHPKAIEFLSDTFNTLVQNYGFVYLKLDFLYSASLNGNPYDKRQSPYQRYRKAIEHIRTLVGPKVFLLGCGASIYPSIGVFDAMRISCDVAPYWDRDWYRTLISDKHALCTESALLNTITRSFMHQTLWINDPDCLLVRKDKNKMTYQQTVMMTTIMALSGGMLLLSDNLSTIDESRLGLFRKALELSAICQKGRSLPVGIFQDKFPRAFYNSKGILGIWNPDKEMNKIVLTLPPKHTLSPNTDYWTGKPLPPDRFTFDWATGRLEVILEAFQTVVFGL